MRIVHFDSVGGASGDMLLGALITLGISVETLERSLKLLLPDDSFSIAIEDIDSWGIHGVRTSVVTKHDHHHGVEHHHRNFKSIKNMIEKSNLSNAVKASSVNVFASLAKAEAKIHNTTPEKVHFHEVGALDSIIDIVGCCLAIEMLNIDAISLSPLPLGQGTLTCQHGIYPVPAPATLELLKGFPVIQTDEPYELVTPTGAALLTNLKRTEKPQATCIVSTISYSFGKRELKDRPNMIRATLYESSEVDDSICEQLVMLETNIDDLSPEITASLFEKLLDSGAMEVFTTPVVMKKQRQGTLLSILCNEAEKVELENTIFTESSTFGIRESVIERKSLKRQVRTVSTKYGDVRVKVGYLNGREITRSPEFEDCKRLAEEKNLPVKLLFSAAIAALSTD